jgi:hypothetical protein
LQKKKASKAGFFAAAGSPFKITETSRFPRPPSATGAVQIARGKRRAAVSEAKEKPKEAFTLRRCDGSGRRFSPPQRPAVFFGSAKVELHSGQNKIAPVKTKNGDKEDPETLESGKNLICEDAPHSGQGQHAAQLLSFRMQPRHEKEHKKPPPWRLI